MQACNALTVYSVPLYDTLGEFCPSLIVKVDLTERGQKDRIYLCARNI